MSDLEKRLRASVRFDAINGDSRERAICGRQMLEAANYIQQLEAERMARLSAPELATVAVDAGALDQLRVTVEAYDNAWDDDMPQLQKIAALHMVEAARSLLAGDKRSTTIQRRRSIK